MADNPQKPARERPLSPHLSIYRWQVTMLGSITHRLTGIGLSFGALVLAWWLVAISNGLEAYDQFMAVATSPIGIIALFGFTWSLAFHLLNGVRHLAWDMGYGYEKHLASQTGAAVFIASLVIAVAAFLFVWSGHAGYLA